jgi:hypothetical protein
MNVKDKSEISQPDGMPAGKAEDDERKSDMFSDRYTVEESRALLYYIFPHYPELREMRPLADARKFLAEYRANRLAQSFS